VLVAFTRLTAARYGVDAIRESGPPARLRVAPRHPESLPHALAQLLVEREFGLKLGVYGQLNAGGDAGRFWSAPADRDARLAHLAHRLQVAGRGDVGRSVTLVAVCMAAWQAEAGRRPVALAGLGAGSLLDVTEIPFAAVAAAVAAFDDSALAWSRSPAGGALQFEWPAALSVLPGRQKRSA
jgi:hypothetical protein